MTYDIPNITSQPGRRPGRPVPPRPASPEEEYEEPTDLGPPPETVRKGGMLIYGNIMNNIYGKIKHFM